MTERARRTPTSVLTAPPTWTRRTSGTPPPSVPAAARTHTALGAHQDSPRVPAPLARGISKAGPSPVGRPSWSLMMMATATRSSLGTFVTGITTLLIGLPFVVVPSITKQYLGDFLANMALQSRFGRILSEAILLDGVSGRLVIIGLFLIMLGVVSHSTRRAGRRERLVMDRANTKK